MALSDSTGFSDLGGPRNSMVLGSNLTDVVVQNLGGCMALVATSATDLYIDSGCGRATDPEMASGHSLGTDINMAPGVSAGHSDLSDPRGSITLRPQGGPRYWSRHWASALP